MRRPERKREPRLARDNVTVTSLRVPGDRFTEAAEAAVAAMESPGRCTLVIMGLRSRIGHDLKCATMNYFNYPAFEPQARRLRTDRDRHEETEHQRARSRASLTDAEKQLMKEVAKAAAVGILAVLCLLFGGWLGSMSGFKGMLVGAGAGFLLPFIVVAASVKVE